MTGRTSVRVLAAACLLVAATVASAAFAPAPGVEGAWHLVQYRLATGEVYRVAGTIFFSTGRWQVAFYVLDQQGTPQRASAEGGTYSLQGDRLEFRHELNFSFGNGLPGLPASEPSMTLRPPEEAAVEPARIALTGDSLRIDFPSGNQILFERAGP